MTKIEAILGHDLKFEGFHQIKKFTSNNNIKIKKGINMVLTKHEENVIDYFFDKS
jgi:hypothetical protein